MSADDGFRTTRAWLVGCLGISAAAANRLVAAVRVLRQLPKLAAAVRTGDVSAEHVRLVTRGGRTPLT